MGDISELRGLVVVVTFLGVFVLLIAWIPPQFFQAGKSREVSVPDIFEVMDIYSFAETKTICLNESGGEVNWFNPTLYIIKISIGNWDTELQYRRANESDLEAFIVHIHYEWIIIPALHRVQWLNAKGVNEGTEVSVLEIETNSVDNASRYTAQCSHFSYYSNFAFNGSLYANFTDAWNHHGLYAFFGVNFDDVNTSYNAFDLIAKLLFFQLPECNVYINALIAIPIWITIGYLVYVLIIKVIPFIAGG